MVNNITAANPARNLLLKYANDIMLSIPVRSIETYKIGLLNIGLLKIEITLNLKKTWKMVVRGKTSTPLPEPIRDIKRNEELTLMGVTFNKQLVNWNTHFEHMISNASSRLYILRVCKHFGYYLQELTLLFNSVINFHVCD